MNWIGFLDTACATNLYLPTLVGKFKYHMPWSGFGISNTLAMRMLEDGFIFKPAGSFNDTLSVDQMLLVEIEMMSFSIPSSTAIGCS